MYIVVFMMKSDGKKDFEMFDEEQLAKDFAQIKRSYGYKIVYIAKTEIENENRLANIELKPMIYKDKRETSILGEGVYNDYFWTIISYGTHPCAYVKLPLYHFLFDTDLTNWYSPQYIECHGGITYNDSSLLDIKTGTWIGWDYNHGSDFNGIYLADQGLYDSFIKNKKWETEEIYEEVKNVIEQLIKINRKIK